MLGLRSARVTDVLTAQIDKCFGFESAVEEAQRALLAGYVEAASARKGLGLIKLMGRQSGYIAMQASMASGKHTSTAQHFDLYSCMALGKHISCTIIIILNVAVTDPFETVFLHPLKLSC